MEDLAMVTITLSAAGTKKAVSRLREFLASVGIGLKQTHAYEALAKALGYPNWNTLQAKLGPPAMPKRVASPDVTALTDSLLSEPGTEASLRRYIDSMQRGQPNYDEMTPELAAATRAQFSGSVPFMQSLGALQSLTFRVKGARGRDIFDAAFEKRRAEFTIGPLTAEGKVAFRSWRVLPTAEEEATIKQRIADGKPDPERQDLLTRLIAGEQNGIIVEEIMSPALIAAVKQHWPTRLQMNQRLGKFVSLQFLHVDTQGWDVYDVTYETGHFIWRVGPLTTDHKLAGMLREAPPVFIR
jgi:hypothetical protein